ncbi:MAG: flagellar export chaperone FliS [Desulfobacteraceae bacterium]|nr:flagellar export chaperone FliS [Desulfobacteraceae bacterium]
MAASYAGINTYINNHYEGMSPEKLVLLLFDAALDRIGKTRQGIVENNIPKRGENLSKAIAIIAELNTSLDPELNDETTRFLRGLYFSILIELPKVSLTNDIEILNRTERYLSQLKKIWVNDVMSQQHTPAKPLANNHKASRISSISV